MGAQQRRQAKVANLHNTLRAVDEDVVAPGHDSTRTPLNVAQLQTTSQCTDISLLLSSSQFLMSSSHLMTSDMIRTYLRSRWMMGGVWPWRYTRPHRICHAHRFSTSSSI